MYHMSHAKGEPFLDPFAPSSTQKKNPQDNSGLQQLGYNSMPSPVSGTDSLSALELYRHYQMMNTSHFTLNSGEPNAYTDSATLMQEIKSWMQEVFSSSSYYDGDLLLLQKTIKEVLSKDPQSLPLVQKYQDIAQLLYHWIKETAYALFHGEKESPQAPSPILKEYLALLDSPEGEPQNWVDFFNHYHILLQEDKKSKQNQFYKNMQTVSPQKNLSAYEQIAYLLRSKENDHNKIMAEKTKENTTPLKESKSLSSKKNIDPYKQISDLIRYYESNHNKIIQGD